MELNINFLLIGVLVLAVINMILGYHKGMVKAVVSLVSLLILSIVVLLAAYGIGKYNDGKFFHVALVVILLAILGLVHHLLSVVFFSAKLVTKLPVVHSVDKLLGIVFGVLETVLILWTLYTFTMMMNLGMVEALILSWTEENFFLTWLYQHNYLAYGISWLLEEFSFIPLAEIMELMK